MTSRYLLRVKACSISCMRGDGVPVELLQRARASLARLSSVLIGCHSLLRASRAVQCVASVYLLQDIQRSRQLQEFEALSGIAQRART